MRRGSHSVLPLMALGLVLAACSPQATDEYSFDEPSEARRQAPAKVIASPDTERALWFASGANTQLLYGNPGEQPMLVLGCEDDDTIPTVRVVRRSPSDAGAKALMAAIGNGQIQRLPVEASWTGAQWVWEGTYMASDPRMAVFAGPGALEVTVPGGGTLAVKASGLPGELIRACAAKAPRAAPPSDPTPVPPNTGQ